MTISSCRIRLLAVLLSMVVADTGQLAAVSYRVKDVGSLKGGTAVAHHINRNGSVVGVSGFPHGFKDHAFFRESPGWNSGFAELFQGRLQRCLRGQ